MVLLTNLKRIGYDKDFPLLNILYILIDFGFLQSKIQ